MTDSDLIKLAQQGDEKAIVSLIAESLEAAKIVKYEIKNNFLKLIIEAEELPDCEKLKVSVRELITNSKINSIAKVILHGQKVGESIPEWSEVLVVNSTPPVKDGASENFVNSNIKSIAQSKPNRDTEQTKPHINDAESVTSQASDFKSEERRDLKKEFIETLQTFKFSSVVPYQEVLNPDLYNSNIVKLLLCFGLFPWIVSSFATSDTGLEDIAWILGIYYAFIWGIVLYNLIKPAQFSLKQAIKYVCFTAFVGIPLLLFIQRIPPLTLLYAATNSDNVISRLIGYVVGVGVLEELCKGVPIYLFMLRSGQLKEPLSSAFYGAMSGLGFAIAEGAHYSLTYAVDLVGGNIDLRGHILLTTVRFISLPLIHAIWAGIVGYFIGLAAINPSRKNAIIFIGVTIAASLHGTYNTFSNSLIGLAILAFSILLFVTYLRRSQELIAEMEQAEADYQQTNLENNRSNI